MKSVGNIAERLPPKAAFADRSDEVLVQMAQEGSHPAFEALMRRHQAMALRVAKRCVGEPHLAKDAVQNAFLSLYRYLPKYKEKGSFRAFLFRSVVNHSRSVMRKENSRERVKKAFQLVPIPKSAHQDEQLLTREAHSQVQRALLNLSDKLRQVLVLRFTAELSNREISQALGIPVGTVKSRIFLGVERLKQAVQEVER